MRKILIIITVIMAFLVPKIKAQTDYVLYFMHLPQATDLNPARQNSCSFYLGLPGISSISSTYFHRGIRYIDAFDYQHAIVNNTDTIFPIDVENLYNRADPMNYLFIQNKINLLNFAFWVHDWYFTFDIYHNNNFAFTYPKSIFLLKDGNYFNDPNQYISLSGLGLDLNIYNSLSLGASKEITEGLIVGGKIKFLQGFANIYTKKLNLDWHVNPTNDPNSDWSAYDWIFNTDLDLRTSIPKFTKLDLGLSSMDFTPDIGQMLSTFVNTSLKNRGLGIDLGAIYNYKDYEFSASIVDLGFIKWNVNDTIYKVDNGQFVFPGIDLARYITNYGVAKSLKNSAIRDSIISVAKRDIIDTIKQQLNLQKEAKSYYTGINTKINIAAAYSPKDWLKLGFLYHAYFFHNKPLSSYTLSANVNFWYGWNVALSYTMFRRSFNNIGLGLSYRLGPLQMYLNMDNIAPYALGLRYLTAYDKPYDQGLATKWVKSSKMFIFHFGLNFVFGCKDNRNLGLLDDLNMYKSRRR